MFPIDSNDAYRKKDGSLTTMGAIGSSGGGGSDLPEYSSSDAGKVLTVGSDGSLEWDTKGEGGGFYSGAIRPLWIIGSSQSVKPQLAVTPLPITSNPSNSTSPTDNIAHPLTDLLNFGEFSRIELYSWFTDAIAAILNPDILIEATSPVTQLELAHSLNDYDFIAIQGMYNDTISNQYNTTIIHNSIDLETPYWFGVKDRNNSYSGTITFIDDTHAELSSSLRIRILGFNR